MISLNLFCTDDNFCWREACIVREECFRVWSKPDTTCHHFFYKEAIFAPVDAVHLMNVGVKSNTAL